MGGGVGYFILWVEWRENIRNALITRKGAPRNPDFSYGPGYDRIDRLRKIFKILIKIRNCF